MTEQKKSINSEKIDAMFKAGVHFGYSKTKRHPSMAPYIFGLKNKQEIIDLEKTNELLDKAEEFISSLAKVGKVVLFVSGKNESREIIRTSAMSIGMPYVAGRWIGGTITNFSEIKKRLAKYDDLVKQKEKGELVKYTKRERMLIDKEIEKLEKMFIGIVDMKKAPDAVFVVDSKDEINAVREAKQMNIPVIAIMNTDCDISLANYPIVANDSSISSVSYIISEIAKVFKESKTSKV